MSNASDTLAPISDEELSKAQTAIFGEGGEFSDEQKHFIRNLGACSVQAFPGTGKTLSLVGKLHVLAQRGIWKSGRGICVISHTNVAVDEIRHRVASQFPEIMEYPNFVGTIQEFVNKFLFMPYLAAQGQKIRFQDDRRYMNFKSELTDYPNVAKRIQSKVNSLRRPGAGDYPKTLFFKKLNSVFIRDGVICAVNDSGEEKEFTDLKTSSCPQSEITEAVTDWISRKHNQGLFLYRESFVGGEQYLQDNPCIKDIISSRFGFAFLDEAQDCSRLQLDILSEIFGGTNSTVFQQIGDVNQTISETVWKPEGNVLYLTESRRFGINLAKHVNWFQVGGGEGVIGWAAIAKGLKLLLYEEGKEEGVLSRFASIIKTETVDTTVNDCCAVAWKHDYLNYLFGEYSEKVATSGTKKSYYRFDEDTEYIGQISKQRIQAHGSQVVYRVLAALLFKHLKATESWADFHASLRNGDRAERFRDIVIGVCSTLVNGADEINLVWLEKKLNELLHENLITFRHVAVKGQGEESKVPDNIFKADGVEVKVATIHSVKGQTHAATLLFLCNPSDIKYLLGAGTATIKTPMQKRLFYVAASRPKSLFALAMPKSVYDGLEDKSAFEGLIQV